MQQFNNSNIVLYKRLVLNIHRAKRSVKRCILLQLKALQNLKRKNSSEIKQPYQILKLTHFSN